MPARDPLMQRYLDANRADAMQLAAESDRLELCLPYPGDPATYVVHFHCKGLVRRRRRIVDHQDFVVAIRVPDDYLRRFDGLRLLTWCEPAEVWHPNIRPPFICVGQMPPATPLVDLIHQVHEIITYQNVQMREQDALNPEACAWARRHAARFPLDRRPLRRPRGAEAPPGPEPADAER